MRGLARRPGVTLVAIFTLALGIGASTAIFSVVEAALLRSLPYGGAERLAMVWESRLDGARPQNVVNLANRRDWKAQSRTLRGFAVFFDTSAALTGSGEPEEVPSQLATTDLFRVLEAQPLLGRTFAPEDAEEGGPRPVILSYGLWQRRYGGDPGIVGRQLVVNGESSTVIGVMPEGFSWHIEQGSMTRQQAQIWVLWRIAPDLEQRRGRFAMTVARLAPGATMAEAQAEMRAIGARLAQDYPEFNALWTVNVVPLRTQLSGALRPSLLVLLGAVAFLLLIACANVSNLLLARATARQHEVAVRAALGAGRGRIVRQLLVESVVLGLAAGIAGVVLAAWGVDVLVRLSPPELGTLPDVEMNLAVLGFALALSFATGILFGLAPALAGSRIDLGAALNPGARDTGGARRQRLRGALVVLETALALMLLVGSALMIASYRRLASVDPGLDATGVLTMRVALPESRYHHDDPSILRFQDDVRERLAALPGVEAVGVVRFLPFAGPPAATRVEIEGEPPPRPEQMRSTQVDVADNGYFRALRIPLVRGRLFTPDEESVARHVVVVNQAFERTHFGGQSALGKRVTIYMKDENLPSTIIGVVGDNRQAGLDREAEPMAFWPHPELVSRSATLVLRTAGDPAALAPAARRVIASVDPELPIADVHTMTSLLSRSVASARFQMFILGIFGVVALLLAAVGIAGVMAVTVAQRTREIGIRIALGARTPRVVGLVVRQCAALALAGAALGIVGAWALSRFLGALLYRVSATDPATFALAAGVLVAVALLACLIPARRAARVDPMIALRSE